MADYRKMYYALFNDVTKAIEELKKAQQKTEEIYTQTAEDNITALDKDE